MIGGVMEDNIGTQYNNSNAHHYRTHKQHKTCTLTSQVHSLWIHQSIHVDATIHILLPNQSCQKLVTATNTVGT